MKKRFHILFFLLFIPILFFVLPKESSANVNTNLDLVASENGDVPEFSLSCTIGRNYTASLVHRDEEIVNKSFGVLARRLCLDGVITFSEFNLNVVLNTADPVTWNVYHLPVEFIVKDTTGLFLLPCAEEVCQPVNLELVENFHDKVVQLASSTMWATVAAGPVFHSEDHSTWSNLANGDGSGNYTPPPREPTYSNILFLPGIKASRLYKTGVVNCSVNCEDKLWEPHTDNDVEALYLDEDGKSLDLSIYTKDVVDEAYGAFNVYKTFIEELEEMKAVDDAIADYSVVPYDWRLSFEDLLENGEELGGNVSYTHPSSDPYILKELRRLAESSDNGKVTIITHSNGGLLAKYILKTLEEANDPLIDSIDKVILVAVPQLGTPSAIAALLHGYGQGIPAGMPLTLSENVARKFGENMQSAYNLLPSYDYFTYVDDPVVTFDPELSEWIERYGSTIHSEETLHNFLIDTYERVDSLSENTSSPNSLNPNLLEEAKGVHENVDNWNFPSGIEVVEVAGWGIPTTIRGVNYEMRKGQIVPEPVWTIDGDGTVVTPSALWGNGDENVERYWVDLKKYNKDHPITTLFGYLSINHGSILEVDEVKNFIESFIKDEEFGGYSYITQSTPLVEDNDKRLIYSLHSPLTLSIYDSLGNHTGVSTTTGEVVENIPGTYFIQIGEVKYIFSESGDPLTISLDGYDTGTFTFSVSEMQGDSVVSTITFKDIPTTPNTLVTMSISDGIASASELIIDQDGDGEADINLNPVINGVVTYTTPAPVVPASSPQGNGPIMASLKVSESISPTPAITPPLVVEGALSITTVPIEPIILDEEYIGVSNQKFLEGSLNSEYEKVTEVKVKKVSEETPLIRSLDVEIEVEESQSISQTAQAISSDTNPVSKFLGFIKRIGIMVINVFK